MTKPRHRLEARNTAGEVRATLRDVEADLRNRAAFMGEVLGQKSWRFDLYEGGTLKATYKRGVWNEHRRDKA
jgi:hypothetical protein